MRMGLYDIYDAFAAYIIHHHILYDFALSFSNNYGGQLRAIGGFNKSVNWGVNTTLIDNQIMLLLKSLENKGVKQISFIEISNSNSQLTNSYIKLKELGII